MARRRAPVDPEAAAKSNGALLVDRILAGERFEQCQIQPSAEFWRLIREYPDKSSVAIYVYRMEPIIDRSLTGHEQSYIEVIHPDSAPDDAYLLNHHGSGKYKVFLSDGGRGKGYSGVGFTLVELSDPQRPPILDVRELVIEHRRNSSYIAGLRARGILPPEGETMTGDSKAIEEMARLTRETIAAARERPEMGSDNPHYIVAISKLLETMRPVSAPVPDPIDMLAKLSEITKHREDPTTSIIIQKLLDRSLNQPAPPSELEQMERYLALADRLRGNAEPTATKDGWASVFAAAPAFLREANSMLATILLARGVPAVPAPAPAAPLPSSPSQKGDEMDLTVLMQVGQSAIDAYNQGRGGDEFADALHLMNRPAWDTLKHLGFDQVYGALKSYPELAKLDGPEIRAWLQAFFDYDPEETEDATAAA